MQRRNSPTREEFAVDPSRPLWPARQSATSPSILGRGEMGSAFGYLYLSGGNLAECLVTGKIAGSAAAALSEWN
jgi:hypothetical protein